MSSDAFDDATYQNLFLSSDDVRAAQVGLTNTFAPSPYT
jgi:hypothetical protein